MPRDSLHRGLADSIRRLARQRKVSLNKLADFAGISRSHLSRILKCESSPSLAIVARLAAALDVEVAELLTRGRGA